MDEKRQEDKVVEEARLIASGGMVISPISIGDDAYLVFAVELAAQFKDVINLPKMGVYKRVMHAEVFNVYFRVRKASRNDTSRRKK